MKGPHQVGVAIVTEVVVFAEIETVEIVEAVIVEASVVVVTEPAFTVGIVAVVATVFVEVTSTFCAIVATVGKVIEVAVKYGDPVVVVEVDPEVE